MLFEDRYQAGRLLAQALAGRLARNTVVLGIPRGGLPLALEIARALDAPLDSIIVARLHVPHHRAQGIGALAEEGVELIDLNAVQAAGLGSRAFTELLRAGAEDLRRRIRFYRAAGPALRLTNRTALIVDDGATTGSSARAACRVARLRGAREVILALPMAPVPVVAALAIDPEIDGLVCLNELEPFATVDSHYLDFPPPSEEQALAILTAASHRRPADSPPGPRSTAERIGIFGSGPQPAPSAPRNPRPPRQARIR